MKLVAWFSEVRKGDISLVGGKGANLGELTSAGVAVPPGFILTAEAYFRFLNEGGLREGIESVLPNLNVHDSAQLEATSGGIKGSIQKASLPPDITGRSHPPIESSKLDRWQCAARPRPRT